MNLHVKKVHCGGYIIINTDNNTHTHVKSKSTAKSFIAWLRNGVKPESEYLVNSARKILTEEEFKRLKKKKEKYININKGVQRVGRR